MAIFCEEWLVLKCYYIYNLKNFEKKRSLRDKSSRDVKKEVLSKNKCELH